VEYTAVGLRYLGVFAVDSGRAVVATLTAHSARLIGVSGNQTGIGVVV